MSSKETAQQPLSPRAEAERIYACLFRGPMPEIIVSRFLAAVPRLQELATPAEQRICSEALRRIDDLEAVELAARLGDNRLALLSRKLRLMVYVAETLPQNRVRFIKDRDSVTTALFALAGAILYTLYKFAKGKLLLRRLSGA